MIPQTIVNSKPELSREDPARRDRRRPVVDLLVKGMLIAWLLASMLFAHSCHGNEDLEMFAQAADWIAAKK